MFISYALRGMRINLALQGQTALPYLSTFHLSISHNVINNLMPFRTGEAAFPLLMKQQFGIAITQSSLYLLLFRILDVFSLLLVSAVILLWQLGPLVSLVAAMLMIGSLLLADPIKWWVVKILGRFSSDKLNKVTGFMSELPTRGGRYSRLVLVTLAIWATKLGAFVCFLLFTSQLNAYQAITGILGADLSSILPIHGIAGTGTFEGFFVLAGQTSDIPTKDLLTSAVQLHIFLLSMTFGTYLLSFVAGTIRGLLFPQAKTPAQ